MISLAKDKRMKAGNKIWTLHEKSGLAQLHTIVKVNKVSVDLSNGVRYSLTSGGSYGKHNHTYLDGFDQ